jgi:hypothetical protein
MHIEISSLSTQQKVHAQLRQLRAGDRVHCTDVGQFLFCKRLLEQWRWSDILLLMMDEQKQVLKQFKYRPPAHDEVPRARLMQDQEQVVYAMEKVFAHCHKVGLQVVSFSDGLVVVPKELAQDPLALCSASALGINDYETYATFAEQVE